MLAPLPYADLVGLEDPISLLASTPNRIAELVRGWDARHWSGTYAPGKWTAAQLVLHLAHDEIGWCNRVRLALTVNGYVVQPYDGAAWVGLETSTDPETAPAAYLALRRLNLILYRRIPSDRRSRPIPHPELGEISIDWILQTLAGHDLHLVAEICAAVMLGQGEQKAADRAPAKAAPRASTPRAPGMPVPKPGPEMQKLLSAFSGTWSISERFEPGETMPGGGVGQGTETYRSGPGGLSLIEEFHSKEADGEHSGLGVAWWDEKAQGYRAVWCDSTNPGGCQVMSHVARWEGDQFVLRDESERMGKKFSFKEVFSDITPTSFTQTLYHGESGGELKAFLTIRATRSTKPASSRSRP